MKNFEKFVYHVVNKWRKDKRMILEGAGLSGLSNREYGDLAEDYVLSRIKNLKPSYQAHKSNGSQSPSDILSVARRSGYWHIMLIQVKSSYNKSTIEKLSVEDKKVFDQFARFLKSEVIHSGLLDDYKDKPIIISTGYAAVLRTKNSHRLVMGKAFKIFKHNTKELDIAKVKATIIETHKL